MASNLAHYSPSADADRSSSDSQPNSPWMINGGPSRGSLTLPPINFDNPLELDNTGRTLPAFHHNQFFNFDSFEDPPANNYASAGNHDPPPSNQQARLPPARISQYEIPGSPSPDPFSDFLDLEDFPPSRPSGRVSHVQSYNNTRASSFVDLTESSPIQPDNSIMPPASRKRKAPGSAPEGARATRTTSSSTTRKPTPKLSPVKAEEKDHVDVVDLLDVEDEAQYEAMKAKKQAELIKRQNEEEANRPVKLAEFQCIICMDNPTDLTVTHCGHLFCSECLFQALHAGDKKCCPVCRTTISTGKPGFKPPKNGMFVLEMKLMTSNKKGKQPVRA